MNVQTRGDTDVNRASSLRGFLVLLRLISLSYLRRHPGRLLVVLLSIALGVAAIGASGNLIRSAIASIRSTWQVTIEGADFRVANGFGGVPEELLQEIRAVEGVGAASALLAETAQLQLKDGPVNLQILAFDFFGDDPIHRGGLGADQVEVPDETALLTRVNAILLERGFAERHGLELGDTIESELRAGRRGLYVAGYVEPSPASAAFGGAIAAMDLIAGQVLLDREGLFNAVDIQVAAGADLPAVEERLRQIATGRATVSASRGDSAEFTSLISNLRLILGVPGVMAIVVAALVIFHAVSAAVSRRKPQIDVVRSLGVSRNSLLALFSIEGLVVGFLGSSVGIFLGILATRLASDIVRTTIASLYQPLAATQIEISWTYLTIGLALGIGITLFAFLAPGRSAIGNLGGLSVVSVSRARWAEARRGAWIGAALIPLGLAAIWLQGDFAGERLAAVAMSGDALVLLGSGLLVPVFLLALSARVPIKLPNRLVLMRLGWMGLSADPARTALVVTAVLIGSAYVMITVGPIVSLRHTIVSWMDRTQNADLVVAASGSIGFFPNSLALPPQLQEILEDLPVVVHAEPTSLITQPHKDRWAVVVARQPRALGSRFPLEVVSGDMTRGQEAMENMDGTIVSRHFAVQHELEVGDILDLRSPTGPVSLRVDAVVEDFSSADLGTVFVTPDHLMKRWREQGVNTYHLWIGSDGISVEKARTEIVAALLAHCSCTVLTRDELRSQITNVIDSMFYMAYALEAVAALVMVVAVLSFFSIALDERKDQINLLRTLGATRMRVTGSLLWEAAWIGLLGSSIGTAIGSLLAKRTTETTMNVGGGFELDFVLPLTTVAITIAGAVGICVFSVLIQRAIQAASNPGIHLK